MYRPIGDNLTREERSAITRERERVNHEADPERRRYWRMFLILSAASLTVSTLTYLETRRRRDRRQ